MRDRVLRVLLVLLALGNVQVGIWATFAPRSFYDDFPGGDRSWVALDGPYNEHLVRDFGATNLAIGVLTIAALLWLTRVLVVTAGLAWIVYGVPHLVYHLRHLDVYDTGDQVANVVVLSLAPLAGLAIVLLSPGAPARQ
ncbi:MAG: hypothetical protein H0V95_06415 [Actinobacteria bacterium]|nr:hypothetical protein [Actinomycetota bacterium]